MPEEASESQASRDSETDGDHHQECLSHNNDAMGSCA